MIRKILPFLLFSGFMLAAQTPAPQPEKPVGGQEVTWVIEGFEKETTEPAMLAAVHKPDTVLPKVVAGEETSRGWRFSLKLPRDAVFMAYKFEDDEKTLLNDDGLFFGQPVYEQSGAPRYDANRLYAMVYFDPLSKRVDRIRKLLDEELRLYPTNWQAFLMLNRIQVQEGRKTLPDVASQLDSLLEAQPDSLEALRFAALEFFFSSPNFRQRGIQLLEACARDYPASDYWTQQQYTIFSLISENPRFLERYESQVFSRLEGKARESGYYILISHALSSGQGKRVQDIATDFLEEFPSSPLAPSFITAMLEVKYRQLTSRWEEEMLSWREKYPESPELNLRLAQYYRDRSWSTAVDYYRAAVKNAREPRAAALFGDAAAAKGKNFAEAGKYLNQAVENATFNKYRREMWWQSFRERRRSWLGDRANLYGILGWLSYKYGKYQQALEELLTADSLLAAIPAYDEELYRHLLTASEETGNLEARQTALLNLLVVEPENTSILKGIEDIYLVEHNSLEGFEEWLYQKKMEVALRRRMNIPVPDLPLLTLEQDTLSLSRFNDKVVVINFWATWCEPCKREIPDLNKLVKKFEDNQKVVFLALSSESPATIKGFLDKQTFLYDQFLDPEGQLSSLFEVSSVPTHMVIDRQGRLQYQHIGAIDNISQVLEMEINSLLSEM